MFTVISMTFSITYSLVVLALGLVLAAFCWLIDYTSATSKLERMYRRNRNPLG